MQRTSAGRNPDAKHDRENGAGHALDDQRTIPHPKPAESGDFPVSAGAELFFRHLEKVFGRNDSVLTEQTPYLASERDERTKKNDGKKPREEEARDSKLAVPEEAIWPGGYAHFHERKIRTDATKTVARASDDARCGNWRASAADREDRLAATCH